MSEQTDWELLELAAKAAGYGPGMQTFGKGLLVQSGTGPEQTGITFDPLNDDGDALRLAVKLKLEIGRGIAGSVYAFRRHDVSGICGEIGDDAAAATRRAIVRAAASLASRPSVQPPRKEKL